MKIRSKMKKLLLTASLFLLPGTAMAQDALQPPLQYDYDPPYETTITRLTKFEEIREKCRQPVGMILGCARLRKIENRTVCQVYVLDDEWLDAYEHTYARTLRHEFGHCNGWGGDHAGGRARGDRREIATARVILLVERSDGKMLSKPWPANKEEPFTVTPVTRDEPSVATHGKGDKEATTILKVRPITGEGKECRPFGYQTCTINGRCLNWCNKWEEPQQEK
jgi:hypothetical protein